MFLVANESAGEDEVIKAFAKVVEGLVPHTVADIRGAMARVGFVDIQADVEEKIHRVAVTGRKMAETEGTNESQL